MIIHHEKQDKSIDPYTPEELTKNFNEIETRLGKLEHNLETFSEMLDEITGTISLRLKHKK